MFWHLRKKKCFKSNLFTYQLGFHLEGFHILIVSLVTRRRWLTDWGWVTHICVNKKNLWFRWWFITLSVPSYYLNQCWKIVNWILINKLQWNLNRNSFSFKEMHLKMSSGKCRPSCLVLNVLKQWSSADWATSHYLNLWWPTFVMPYDHCQFKNS